MSLYTHSYFRLVSWWYGYQCLVWICMMTCWVYKLCSVVSSLYLQVIFMAWYGLSFPIDLSLLMHIQIGGLDLGCLCPKSHDFIFFSSCSDEMMLPDIVMVEDCGWLFYANRLDILRVICSLQGCDHDVIDFAWHDWIYRYILDVH